jgi:hypothetical protein
MSHGNPICMAILGTESGRYGRMESLSCQKPEGVLFANLRTLAKLPHSHCILSADSGVRMNRRVDKEVTKRAHFSKIAGVSARLADVQNAAGTQCNL